MKSKIDFAKAVLMKKKVKCCQKCGKKLKRIKTELMQRAEISNPEDPYDGTHKPIYFYVCACWSDGNTEELHQPAVISSVCGTKCSIKTLPPYFI